jgi:hypothetical protein
MNLKRKGIALLWVVLASTLILVGIVGMSMKVVPQKKIENSRQYTQRALAVAESGLAETTYKFRTGQLTLDNNRYDSKYVAYNSGVATTGQSDSTYRVIITKTATGYTFYSLGTLYSQSGAYTSPSAEEPAGEMGEITPLARQAITVRYSESLPIGKYALFTSDSINVQNGTVNGDVFANVSITVGNSGKLLGTAYCPSDAGIGGKGIDDSQKDYNVRETDFPKIKLDKYQQYWDDFLNGTGVYDGTHAGYPNTQRPDVRDLFKRYLGITAFDVSHPPAFQSTPDGNGFDSFFTQVKTGTDTGSKYLRGFLPNGTMVYDVQPSIDRQGRQGTDVVFNQEPYKSNPYLEGTLIIEGNLSLTSDGVTLGDPARPQLTAVLVTGAVDVGNVVSINGLLYIEGVQKQGNESLSFNGAGNLTCTGSIVAKGGIKINSDKLTITYHQNNMYDTEISPQVSQGGLSPVASSWQQISYDDFKVVAGD